jgi:hypothetical protein
LVEEERAVSQAVQSASAASRVIDLRMVYLVYFEKSIQCSVLG